MRDYPRIAQRYAEQVSKGKIPTSELVRSICERALRDWRDRPSGLVWSAASVRRVCGFCELLHEIKGPHAGQPLHLSPWQVFLLAQVFGWLRQDGRRRYRRVYVEVPRGNGKSTLSAAVALYMLLADDEPGAECYSFAVTRDQARIVFDTAREMARRTPHLRNAFRVEVGQHSIYVPSTASKLAPMSSDADTLEGLNVHFGCIDELHAHKTRRVYDVVETALGKRRNSLLWVITTAGYDQSSVCYELHRHVRAMVDGSVHDDSQFGLIYSPDPDDDWTSDDALVKANPNLDVSVQRDVVVALRAKAMSLPSGASAFRTRHLCQWMSVRESWMDVRAWDSCADRTLDIAQFAGEPCWIGLDLAERTDISSAAILFRRLDDDGKEHYYLFAHHYLPRQTIERGENAHYRGWHAAGRIIDAGDASIDQSRIYADIMAIAERHRVQALYYDPAYASQLILRLENDGLPCVVMRPSVVNFSDPMKHLESLVLDRRLHHDGDPVLAWMASNVVARRDDKGNVYPIKQSEREKIDGIVAAIMALAGACSAEQPSGPSVYEERGLTWV